MTAKWLTSVGSAIIGGFVMYQTLFNPKVSEATLFLRLVLYVAMAVLLMAVGRPHPKVTN